MIQKQNIQTECMARVQSDAETRREREGVREVIGELLTPPPTPEVA